MSQVVFPLARQAIDRDHDGAKDPELLATLWADSNTRVMLIHRGRAAMAATDPSRLALFAPEDSPDGLLQVYLGRSLASTSPEPVGTPLVMVLLDPAADAPELCDETDVPVKWGDLRSLAASLSDRDGGLFVEGLAIANWHGTHTHCPRCGARTVVEQGGWVRRCVSDNSEHFPRTDPAVIVCITDADDRILLGSNAMWELNRYSLLAGFVGPGESLEAAVIREVFEESGLRVTNPQYVGSQPWPFPASLMFGYTATLAEGEDPASIHPDGEEILDLRWFSRADLDLERDTLLLPGSSSIARSMIERWYGQTL